MYDCLKCEIMGHSAGIKNDAQWSDLACHISAFFLAACYSLESLHWSPVSRISVEVQKYPIASRTDFSTSASLPSSDKIAARAMVCDSSLERIWGDYMVGKATSDEWIGVRCMTFPMFSDSNQSFLSPSGDLETPIPDPFPALTHPDPFFTPSVIILSISSSLPKDTLILFLNPILPSKCWFLSFIFILSRKSNPLARSSRSLR